VLTRNQSPGLVLLLFLSTILQNSLIGNDVDRTMPPARDLTLISLKRYLSLPDTGRVGFEDQREAGRTAPDGGGAVVSL